MEVAITVTELIWDGKYKDGKKQGPVRIALPFQTIETVNESAQDRQRTLELFATGRETEWRNRLIWGDRKYVLPSLLPEFGGKVNLVYIDPPFNTGADFSYAATIPARVGAEDDEASSFVKEPSILEQKAYRDTWGRGLDSYLEWFCETVVLLRDLLTADGGIFVHMGPDMAGYARCILDEIFGFEQRLNQIIWKRTPFAGSSKARSRRLPVNHDVIFWYSKSESYQYATQYEEYEPEYYRRFRNPDNDPRGPYQSVLLKTYSERTFERFKAEKLLIPPQRSGAGWRYKQFLSDLKGRQVEDIWADLNLTNPMAHERTGYDTQKPEALLERIIKTSSKERDLVLDCFVGSGTTAVVAERLGRRWIACDLSRFAIHTARKRLLGIPGVRPFVVQNLGKYERQAWQAAEFPANGENRLEEQRQREAAYRAFILDLYHASPISGNAWLHGMKGGRMVHVGAVDAPVTLADVKVIARETWKAIGSSKGAPTKAGADILGWEFAFELNELAKQVAAESRIDVAFKKIPREVLDRRAVEQGDVRFFELGALSVDINQKRREAILKLTDFVIPTDDIPEEARKAIKHWSQLIDYWAVDWDFKSDTFHNQWQTYRTRKEPKINLETKHSYPEPGKYTIVVKVIDILGNDTTKTLDVKVD